ncbi:MAG: T9SS type A sorting domain-containing protein [Bacteroidia bacterium]|nr:T9SS type A sorting domain-containing protein [Bacteroidia bacterium]
MNRFFIFLCLLLSSSLGFAQSLTFFYEITHGLSDTDTITISVRNNEATDISIGAVNLSLVYQSATTVYKEMTFDAFKDEWNPGFLFSAEGTASETYGSFSYDRRWQYGNTDNDFSSPTYLLVPAAGTMLLQKIVFSTTGVGPFVMEDIFQNLANDVTDENGQEITYATVPLNDPFPVEWLSFDARQLNNSSVLLTWETANETNNDFFQVEKSLDKKIFTPIGKVQGAGTTTAPHFYEFTDTTSSPATLYYRIKQVDYDGEYTFSDVRQIEFTEIWNFSLDVYPNPATHQLFVKGDFNQKGNYLLVLSDLNGRIMHQESLSGHSVQLKLEIADYAPGMYNMSIVDTDLQKSSTIRFIKK